MKDLYSRSYSCLKVISEARLNRLCPADLSGGVAVKFHATIRYTPFSKKEVR